MIGKRKIAALVAEFLGTSFLTLLILSVQRSSIGVPFFVAAAAGLTFALICYTVGEYSGGFFNPAITLGLWTARKLSTLTAVAYIVAQFVGAYVAFGLYTYFVNQHLQSVGGHFSGRILAGEAVGTGIFSFALASTVYKKVNLTANSIFAGLALMVGMIAASSASIGLLNPAVALGVKSWVLGTYVLGPVLGAVIGINLYAIVYTDAWSNLNFSSVSAAKSAPVEKTTIKKTTVKKKATKKK
jgi:aquaporin Z